MSRIKTEIIRFITPVTIGTDAHRIMPLFAQDKELDYLPVVDESNIPLGIISEKDLKHYAFSLYGRELIRKKILRDFVLPCPSIEKDSQEDDLLAAVGAAGHAKAVIITEDSRYLGFVNTPVLLELYERNRLEKQQELLRAQRLEALGTLTGGIAHELNNLLVPIVGYSDVLLQKTPKESAAVQHLERILAAAERAKCLVEQILSFSRKGRQVFSSVSLSAVVSEVCGLIRVSTNRDIEIRTLLDAQPDLVEGNATQIHQVLVNLCSNAAKAIEPRAGRIDISLSKVSLPDPDCPGSVLPAGDYLRIAVADSGCGIPPEIIDKIFDPFFTTRRNSQGTGLGLSVVHGIVKSHGGAVTVESAVGNGSTFRVYLPVSHASQAIAASAAETPLRGNGKILIVDDNNDVATVWAFILQNFGYEITVLNDSNVALEGVRERPDHYDLVITDQLMPNLCGSELASEVWRINPAMPMILCTGYSNSIAEEEAVRIGFRKYLRKPLKSSELVSAVQEVLQRGV